MTRKPIQECFSLDPWWLVDAQVLHHCYLYIPLILQEQDLELILEKLKVKDNSKVWWIVAQKSSQVMVFQGYIEVLEFQFLGIFIYRAFYFGMYDAGKKLVYKDADSASFLSKFAFA